MPISMICGSCGKKVRAPDSAAGMTATCPHCQARFQVPSGGQPTIIDEPSPISTAISDAKPIHLSGSSSMEGSAVCPFCAETIKAGATKCKHCGERLDDNSEFDRRSARTSRNASRSNRDDDGGEARSGFSCPFCKASTPPIIKNQISQTGWMVFVLLLIFCFPLCWIGLFIRDDYRVCLSCGMKLG